MLQVLQRIAAGRRRGFSRFLLSIVLLFLISTPGQSACVDDALQSVDGDALLMESSAVYRLVDDWRAVVFWLPLSKVTICDQLDNVAGEIVIYYEIRNHDASQMVRAMRER
jgi:hypothetical protein